MRRERAGDSQGGGKSRGRMLLVASALKIYASLSASAMWVPAMASCVGSYPVSTCFWGACGVLVGCLWGAYGVLVGCLFGACGVLVGYLWAACGVIVGCLWQHKLTRDRGTE